MKHPYTVVLLCLFALSASAQYSDPNFPKPVTGYGSDGTHTVGVISYPNPYYLMKDIEIYHPSDVSTPVPTIFYSHAYGGTNSANIIGLLQFVAMKGYAIVYVPYQTTKEVSVEDRYANLLSGFRQAARTYPNIIDTTRVGFLGHSFGGGASFGNAYACFTENHWGENGRFIYALAQWYSYHISEAQLNAFPANTNLLVEIFADDETNDHRMAIDIFNHISIPNADKDFLLLKSDTLNGYIYAADHVVPNTSAAFNAFDYYAYYRLLDALCDYTFQGNLAGKDVALGDGSTAQVTLPAGLRSLVQTDSPAVWYPDHVYLFACSDSLNMRPEYCDETTAADVAVQENSLSVFPNPASGRIAVQLPPGTAATMLYICDFSGKAVLKHPIQSSDLQEIDLTPLAAGLYWVQVENRKCIFVVQ